MRDKIIPILNVCTALFVILYAAYIFNLTRSISLVTIVFLIAGLTPVLHMAWNYLKIKAEAYEKRHFHRYMKH